ncbi:MAG TPA: hypothetical protein VFH24_04570 [Gemmatimonadales bacterium]|nr:hypothetical protein [Gemmatimonadales bacterium]
MSATKGVVMRVLSLVFSLVVTLSLGGAALIYLEDRIGQHRIQVQDEWLSSPDQQQAYRSYGDERANPDSGLIALADSAR